MRPVQIVSLLLASGVITTGTMAQDSPSPAPPPTVVEEQTGREAARLRESLERRRALVESMRERLDEAIARLDRGEAIDADLADGRGFMLEMGEEGPNGPRFQRGGRPDVRPGGGARGGGFDGQAGGGPGEPGQQPTMEEIRRLRALIDENLPLLAERMRAAERSDPQAAPRMIGRIAPRLREAFDAKERSPEVFKLRILELEQGFEVLDAARRTRRVVEAEGAESPSAVEAKARFRELAAAHFDTQVQLQSAEVAELEARIADLRAEIDRKTTHRDEEIDARVDQVLRGSRPERPDGAGGPSRPSSEPGRGRRSPD
jgi:uncharacterized small protein (DUF1192 family)